MIFNSLFNAALRRGLGCKFNATIHQPHTVTVSVLSRTSIQKTSVVRKCRFHTTPPRNALPPPAFLFVRSGVKLFAVICGVAVRKWWSKLTPEQKKVVLAKIRSKRSFIAAGATILAGVVSLYYIEHLVDNPVTKRKRFIAISPHHVKQIADFEYERQLILYQRDIIPASHRINRRVIRVVNSLLLSNKDMKEITSKTWSVTVINRPDVVNAFVLPDGKIFVFTGLLNLCTSDDELAVVLGHEIAHCVLAHVPESISRVLLRDFIFLIPSIFIWSLLPRMWAFISDWLTTELTQTLLHLAFRRSIEKEADFVGLLLAARSCYDVTKAPGFWMKMKYVSNDFPFEWLSTHPSHEERVADTNELLPIILEVRKMSNCPPLPHMPRNYYYYYD